MDEWVPAGFRVEQVLGFGASGEVWRAREVATGAIVALQRLHQPSTPELGARLRATAAVLAGLPGRHLVRVREVHDDARRPVLVLDHAAGGSLSALLRRREVLSAGELVTVGVPLARALAAAHGAGLVHGALSPTAVLLTDDGMPLLSGTGLVEGGTAEGDVRDLLALCRRLITGSPRPPDGGLLPWPPGTPAALVAVLDGPVASAEDLATRLAEAHPAAPLDLRAGGAALPGSREFVGRPAAVREVRRRVRGHRRPGRGRAGVLGALLLAVCGVVAVLLLARPAPPVAVPVPMPAAAPDWVQVLDGLDRARERAFAAADPGLLAEVHLRGSPAARADGAAVAALRERGRTAQGVRHALGSVQPRVVAADRAELEVVDALGPQRVRDGAGRVVQRTAGRGERRWVAVLVRTGEGWRLAEVAG